MKLNLKNETGYLVDFCSGEKEYSLQPGEEISIEVFDEDCMYFDGVKEVHDVQTAPPSNQ